MSDSQAKRAAGPPPLSADLPSTGEQRQNSLVRAIAWTGLVKWSSQGLSWVSTIVVARLLLPSDFGLVALAGAFLGLVALVNEFGLASAIVMLQKLSTRQIGQLNSLAVLLGFAGFGFACLGAIPLGRFYRDPELPLVIVVLAVGFVVGAFRSVPNAILEKRMRFRTLSLLEGGQSLLAAIAAVLLAWNGAGYWALVLGNLLANMVATGVVVAVYGQAFARPAVREVGDVLRFSWYMMMCRVSWYLASTSDVFITGRLLGQAPLGAYSFGTTLANLPLEKVTALVNRVTPAFVSAVQDDFSSLRSYLLRLTEGLAIITFPAAFGLALVSGELVPLVLGEKWHAVIVPLGILAAYSSVRSVSSILGPILFVTGGARFGMFNGFWTLAVLPIGFYVGSAWGVVGIAVAWVVVHPLSLFPMYWRVFSTIQLRAGQYLTALWPALSATAAMAIAVLSVRLLLPVNSGLAQRFVTLVAVGSVAYLAAMLGLHQARVQAFLSLIRAARSPRP